MHVENRFAKISNDVKKAVKLSERVNIQGPSSGIYMAHTTGSNLDADQRVNAVKAQVFTLEAQYRETEADLKA